MNGDAAGEDKRAARGYVSYSYDDHEPVQRLLQHLLPRAQRELGVSFGDDRSITSGSHWDHEIAATIARADIFILCMTADYLGSKYLYYREFPAIRERHNASKALVIPVILRPCSWWGFVSDFRVAPTRNGRVKPISEWRPQENGYLAAVDQIIDAIRAHLGLPVTKDDVSPTEVIRRTPRLAPVTLPGPHRVSPEDIDRVVAAVVARHTAKSEI